MKLLVSFEASGFEARMALSPKEGYAIAKQFHPVLVVVDFDLQAAAGFDFCWNLRNSFFTSNVQILMLSEGRGDDAELSGLSRGADDYLVKPFQIDHLIYRVRILLKRSLRHEQFQRPITRDGLELDFDGRIAAIEGMDLGLTITQFRLIWALAQKPGCVFSRLELVNQCRGDDANCLERVIDVHIRTIRRKLGKLSYLVETMRGVGYRFRDPDAPSMVEPENEQDSVLYDDSADLVAPTSASIAGHLTAISDHGDSRSIRASVVLQAE